MGRLGGSVVVPVQFPPQNDDNPALLVENCNNNGTDTCSSGHCCADNICCKRLYEHWWFWCIWVVVFVLGCCCYYHHQRRNQSSNNSRQHNRQEGAYAGVCNYPGPPVDKEMLGYCKLPKYDEVIRIPPSGSPPPPYSERRMFASIARMPSRTDMGGLQIMQQNDLTSSVINLVTSAFNLNFRGSSTIISSLDSNQDMMDSISELNANTFHTSENTGPLVTGPAVVQNMSYNEQDSTLPKKALITDMDDAEFPGTHAEVEIDIDLPDEVSETASVASDEDEHSN